MKPNTCFNLEWVLNMYYPKFPTDSFETARIDGIPDNQHFYKSDFRRISWF